MFFQINLIQNNSYITTAATSFQNVLSVLVFTFHFSQEELLLRRIILILVNGSQQLDPTWPLMAVPVARFTHCLGISPGDR